MLPESLASPETSYTVKMLAVIEQWDAASGCYTDNTGSYLLLILLKLGMDVVVFYFCCPKRYAGLLSMCSLSIVLADSVMAFFMATVMFLEPKQSLVSPCFLLANASATYGALPLPMMCLGLLDYCLQDTCLGKQSPICKFLRNAVLTLLVWMLAVIYSYASVKTELMELDYVTGITALVCEVQESSLITYFTLGLSAAVICAMLPFWSRIRQWVKEADKLCTAREGEENQRSDLLFTSTKCADSKSGGENYPEETAWPRPPLWLSLTLGFSMFWLPYLTMSVACDLLFGFGVPAYVTVNLLWLECTNSLLVGVVFWVKSKTLGPYSHFPENVCSWQVYWHLSKGTRQHQLPVAVFNPSKGKRNTLFHV